MQFAFALSEPMRFARTHSLEHSHSQAQQQCQQQALHLPVFLHACSHGNPCTCPHPRSHCSSHGGSRDGSHVGSLHHQAPPQLQGQPPRMQNTAAPACAHLHRRQFAASENSTRLYIRPMHAPACAQTLVQTCLTLLWLLNRYRRRTSHLLLRHAVPNCVKCDWLPY